ncbi:spermidine synthase [Actinospongicola halichondriae]|uniref:spermidine synthase n=1 Tax=Actinospongicola halichondriae TaxID=3236844 RepID=UPI003D499EA4
MFQEIDRRPTPMGDISLRRRVIPTIDIEVYEVILGDEHLMSSLFTVAEVALADLGLAACEGDALDVVVGGLGLGYTAGAALGDARVRSVHVVDALPDVIRWHREGVLALSPALHDDDRCHLVEGDFFAMVADGAPFGPDAPDLVHAVLLDVDHTPRHVLHPSHAPFYEVDGLQKLHDRLHPAGVFALWSDDAPDDAFVAAVETVFGNCAVHDVPFPNPHTGGEARNAVVVAVR